ncbi:hypothetical protein [Paenibacillus sacheonensis]|uniref:Uncharacterized protein n=1 Tax=Paenibacillus sacheonensis TaxID=742054 RepID=A0A7X5C2Q0_9BACL|nr:hypothetical protein [Paenibacillus sacheonensis]MBM7566642.1 hypothetical protein [Paenibacillus sacheonensis]NBC70624.1 hypothetical protein [Paenibacillus sacheonensis]
MKAAKWLKWKVGAACTVLLVLVFQLIKSSPAYQNQLDVTAAAKTAPDFGDLRSDDEDDIMQDWQDQEPGDSYRGTSRTENRSFSRHGSRAGGQQQQNSGGFDASTGRS